MKTAPAPSKVYSSPGYVTAFRVAGLLCLGLGLLALFLAFTTENLSPWTGVGILLAGLAQFLYADIAEAIARTHWRVELLAYQLAPAIDEINLQSDRRTKLERDAERAREEEIRQIVARGRAMEAADSN